MTKCKCRWCGKKLQGVPMVRVGYKPFCSLNHWSLFQENGQEARKPDLRKRHKSYRPTVYQGVDRRPQPEPVAAPRPELPAEPKTMMDFYRLLIDARDNGPQHDKNNWERF